MILLLLVFAAAILLLGLVLWRMGRRAHQATGLPTGEVVYTDTGAWERVPEPLLSRRYGLVGKPDYLVRVQTGGQTTLVPVEVKSPRLRRGRGLAEVAILGNVLLCHVIDRETLTG